MNLTPDKTQPLDDWLLCRAVPPVLTGTETRKLHLPSTIEEKGVVTEGVAEVLAVGPGFLSEEGVRLPTGVEVGDKVLYRGFLRFAQQMGDLYGGDMNSRVFFLSARDVLAVVEGPGTIGRHDEYVF